MKTIVHVINKVINAGPVNVIYNICKNIDRSKYLPVLVSLENEDKHRSIESKFREINVDIIHIGATHIELELFPKVIAKRIMRIVKGLSPIIYHSHTYQSNIIVSKIKRSHKICTLHNINTDDYIYRKGKLLGMYMIWRFNHSLHNYDYCVSISENMYSHYQRFCHRIVNIPNGVSVNCIRNSRNIRDNLKVAKTEIVIIVVGSIDKRKNTPYIISELQKSTFDFTCFILGEGELLEICKSIARNDNRFRFEGFCDNVSKYLSIADLYISASLSEGFPLSVLEAVNYGIPSLLSEIPPHCEIANTLDVDGVTTYPLKENALTNKFNYFFTVNNDRELIKSRAYSNYSAEVMTEKYETLYDII